MAFYYLLVTFRLTNNVKELYRWISLSFSRLLFSQCPEALHVALIHTKKDKIYEEENFARADVGLAPHLRMLDGSTGPPIDPSGNFACVYEQI